MNKIRDVRKQLTATMKRARSAKVADALKETAAPLRKALKEIEEALIQTRSKSPQDPLNYPVKLNDKLKSLLMQTGRNPRPTQGALDLLASLKERVKTQLDALDAVLTKQVPAFNAAAAKAPVPAVVITDK